jgi:hypothetical protein
MDRFGQYRAYDDLTILRGTSNEVAPAKGLGICLSPTRIRPYTYDNNISAGADRATARRHPATPSEQ